MKFIADFHIHSKYSRATSKNLDLENLYIAAQKKGLKVIGTGDFTHPGWFSEIEAKLTPAEDGLFKLKEDIASSLERHIPKSCRDDIRFILTCEISNIYKKNGKTRKNHNLIFIPDLHIAKKFNAELAKIGNVHSDGRPILGLDAKHLLEIVLETSEKNFLIPAHIWTPWFSLLGSKSGFDTVEACFEDLTPYIFAVETGLSSDPPMNWRVKFLDGLTLISNSDAHSPGKLGREANRFDTDLSFDSIRGAMESGDPDRFLGTLEFYPEEGKYHLDGHRKCGVRSWPAGTMEKAGICPVCKRPMTLGVLYRVEELASRLEGQMPSICHPYQSIIPLEEILSELLGVGPNTKKVSYHYERLLDHLGPELKIVNSLSLENLERVELPHLSEAIQRVRRKKVNIDPGFDGEFGKIEIFDKEERAFLFGQKPLFKMPNVKKKKGAAEGERIFFQKKNGPEKRSNRRRGVVKTSPTLNGRQQRAIRHTNGPMIIVAGPGTGKTLTITHKIASLIENGQAGPDQILALTFTNKAAQEMRQRLQHLLQDEKIVPLAATFHAFCVQMLAENEAYDSFRVVDESERRYFLERAVSWLKRSDPDALFDISELLERIAQEKRHIRGPHHTPGRIKDDDEINFQRVYAFYQKLLSREGLWDYEDLLCNVVNTLENDPARKETIRNRYRFLFIDEYQDVNFAQYRMIRQLAPADANICVIGDPDQSIYGFRGSDVRYFNRFTRDYPGAESINLSQNYRSVRVVLEASQQLIRSARENRAAGTGTVFSKIDGPEHIEILPCFDEKGEAVTIGKEIEKMVGGVGFYSIDFDKTDLNSTASDYSFGDFAVLMRTARQCNIFAEVFERAGIPCQVVSKKEAYSEKCVLAVLSFLKIVSRIGSYLDVERVCEYSGSGVGRKTVTTWRDWAFENGFSLDESLKNIRRFPLKQMKKERQLKFVQFIDKLERMRLETKDCDLQETIDYILINTTIREKTANDAKKRDVLDNFIVTSGQYDSKQALCLASALDTDTDMFDSRAEKVALMTMHASKGLEFPVVFISGCERGLVPFVREGKHGTDEDEERRLLYVAMTRAKQALFLSYAQKRSVFGKKEAREPSKFMFDIRQGLKNYRKIDESPLKKRGHTQLELF